MHCATQLFFVGVYLGLHGVSGMLDWIIAFVNEHKPYFELAKSLSSVLSAVAWLLTLPLLVWALLTRRVQSFSVAGASFNLREAVDATARAARDWNRQSGKPIDVRRIRATAERAFRPENHDNLTGKSILWVDDNPNNNSLAVRALRKYGLEVEQVLSTEAAMEVLGRQRLDLVISDMGRAANMRAGYELLDAVRSRGISTPFFIFAGDDKPEFRREAKSRGAQLSTNDMIEQPMVHQVAMRLGWARPPLRAMGRFTQIRVEAMMTA